MQKLLWEPSGEWTVSHVQRQSLSQKAGGLESCKTSENSKKSIWRNITKLLFADVADRAWGAKKSGLWETCWVSWPLAPRRVGHGSPWQGFLLLIIFLSFPRCWLWDCTHQVLPHVSSLPVAYMASWLLHLSSVTVQTKFRVSLTVSPQFSMCLARKCIV